MSRSIFQSAERFVLTVDETAIRLGLHRHSVRAAIDRGELYAVKLGRRWLVPVEALDDLLRGRSPSRPDSESVSGQ